MVKVIPFNIKQAWYKHCASPNKRGISVPALKTSMAVA
jgi:hypothetical protein